jgi:hypothetical protein
VVLKPTHRRKTTAQAANSRDQSLLEGLLICGSGQLHKYRGQGEEKLQYLPSFQADRCVTGWLTSIGCGTAMRLRPADTSLVGVLACKSMPMFQKLKSSVTHLLLQ